MPGRRGRYEKSVFHSGLAIIRSRYLDVFHRHAKKEIPLTQLTQTLRAVPKHGAVQYETIPPNATIYGAFNTQICQPVTKESLDKRMGIAQALQKREAFKPPSMHLPFWKVMRAKRLAGLFAPILRDEGGPMYDVTGAPGRN